MDPNQKWVSWLSNCGLIPEEYPPSTSFKVKSLLLIIHSLHVVVRWFLTLICNKNSYFSPFLVGSFYFLGTKIARIGFLAGILFFLHIFAFQIIFLFKRKIMSQVIMKQVFFIDKKNLDFIFNAMHWLTITSFSAHGIVDIYFLCLALKYGEVILVNPSVTIFLWISGTVVKMIHNYFMYQQTYALYGFWLATATRVVSKINSMIDSMINVLNIDHKLKVDTKINLRKIDKYLQRMCQRMRRKRINRMIDRLIKDYVFICEMIIHFNTISKNMLFIMTLSNVFTNALLLHMHSIIKEDPVISWKMFLLWFNFMSGSIFILKTAASVAKKSQTMYRLPNSMYVRKGDALTLNQRKQMLFMIENGFETEVTSFSHQFRRTSL